MTYFSNQTFNLILPLSKLDFKDYEIALNLNKNDIPHHHYIIIKDLSLQIRLSTNQYQFSYDLYRYWCRNSILNFNFKIDNENFYVKQEIIPIFDNFKKIWDILKDLNPLYNEIDDLPSLKISLLKDYEMSRGFENLNLSIPITKDHNGQYIRELPTIGLCGKKFDIKNAFYYELKIEYSVEPS